jgi:hypothetical protein
MGVAVTVNLATRTGTGGDAQGDVYGSIENLTGTPRRDFQHRHVDRSRQTR